MSQSATSVRSVCPMRPNVPFDAPVGPTSYARMFPELPACEGDEQFLHALGRTGGACDGGDTEDSPDSLSDTAAGWPIFGQFVAHDITADRCFVKARVGFAHSMADLYRSSLPAQLIVTVTVRFGIVTS